MASYKPVEQSKNIALVSKMDQRTNPVYLNNNKQDTSYFLYLQNADLFNKQSLSSRLGTTPFVEGLPQYPDVTSKIFDFSSITIPSGTTDFTFQTTASDPIFDAFAGMIIVPSGNTNLLSGTFIAASALTNSSQINTPEYRYDIDFNVNLYTLNQIPLPASGAGFFSGNGTFGNNTIYNIGLSGTYPNSPLPAIAITTPVPTTNLIAIASSPTVNFGSYSFNPTFNKYMTSEQEIGFSFVAPVPLYSGNVYYVRVEPTLTSGTTQRSIAIKYIHEGAETGANTRLASDSPGGGGSLLVSELGQEKSQLYTTMYKYDTPAYIMPDDYLATFDIASPLKSGTNFTSAPSFIHVADQFIAGVPGSSTFNGATRVPNIETDTVEFGSVVNIRSGTSNINGAYFYATPNDRPGWESFNRNKQRIVGDGYKLGYICNLSEIISSTGTVSNGNFSILNRNVINTFSGIYTFGNTNDLTGTSNSFINSEYALNKVYSIFSNPSVITTTGADYLLSFKYFDATTGLPYTDYSYKNITTGPFAPTTLFQSFMMNGVMMNGAYPSGVYLSNYSNDAQTFIMPSGDASTGDARNNSLTCGLITLASGSSINGIVDYTTSTLSQRIVYNQGDKIKAFTLANRNPSSHIVIKTGLTVDVDALASYQVYDDLLLETNYSFDQPQIWSSTYVNSSGNSTYDLGQRPSFALSLVSGTSNLVSGTYNVMLTTEMLSGGIRSSIPQTIFASGITVSGSVNNVAIAVSGINIGNQYPFDIFSDSTAIWTTLPSTIAPNADESVFYLANLSSGTALSGTYYSNPMPNNINVTYINDLNGVTDTIIEDVYPEVNQAYMLNQLNTPKLKKVALYYDYILAFGDLNFPSRLYWSQQFGPQIYGGVSSEYGYTPVAENSGDPITGVAHWKNYMLIFKKNSMYRMDYTAQSIPFQIDPVSVEMGCLSLFSIVETDDYVYGINQYGVFRANANGIECISKDIDPYFKSLDTDQLTFSVGLKNTNRNTIYWSITNDTSNEDNTIGIAFNYEFGQFSIRKGGLWNSAAVIRNVDSFDILLGGDYNGQIKQIDTGTTDIDLVFSDGIVVSSTSIEFEALGEWIFFDNDSTNKIIDRLHFNVNDNQGYLLVDIYLDGNAATPKYTRKINLAGNSPDKICNLGGIARSVMFKIRNVNTTNTIRIDSFSLDYQVIGLDKPM